jgi:hypothetical protein
MVMIMGAFNMRAFRMCIPGEWLADVAQSHAEIIVLQNFPLQVMRLCLSNQFPNWIQIVRHFNILNWHNLRALVKPHVLHFTRPSSTHSKASPFIKPSI